MGKDKEQKTETPGNAFARMNYLYQAAQLTSKIPDQNPLSNYYNKLMKEISKKVLERLHPDLKRTMCCACNYPLTAGNTQVNVKIKTCGKKRKKKNGSAEENKKESFRKRHNNIAPVRQYSKHRTESRNKRPNSAWWTCDKCGYSKGFVQRPSKKLWIHEAESKL